MFNSLEKLFIVNKCNNLQVLKDLFRNKTLNERNCRTSLRVLINYCEDKEFLEDDLILKLRNKIKLSISTNIDTYVPMLKHIKKSLDILSRSSYDHILYSLILESGCRPSELKEMIITFDVLKIEVVNEIVIYRNFYLRNSKNSFYLFFTKKTFDKFLDCNFTVNIFNSFKERILRNKNIINLKYLRKYQFTLLIKAGVSFEIANFIQGRSSNNIGFNH
jgi:intergrase/recombinase